VKAAIAVAAAAGNARLVALIAAAAGNARLVALIAAAAYLAVNSYRKSRFVEHRVTDFYERSECDERADALNLSLRTQRTTYVVDEFHASDSCGDSSACEGLSQMRGLRASIS
jgi:hypothetical protein